MKNDEVNIKKVLVKEAKLIIYIIVLVISVLTFITKPTNQLQSDMALIKRDIQTIEENHLKHIKDDIATLKNGVKENEKNFNEINLTLTEIKALLK